MAQAQDYTYETNNGSIVITRYIGTNSVVVIPSTINGLSVTAIGGIAYYSSLITSVTIPAGVTTIGGSAFYCCSKITSITIPDSVNNIGSYAFYQCWMLNNVRIPNGVASILENTFAGCGMTNIVIPNSVTSIGIAAFSGCRNLINVTFPSGMTTIPNNSFSGCKLTNLTIPDSVTSIGERAFSGCATTSVIIPSSVTSLGDWAFYSCANLTGAYFKGSPPGFGTEVFTYSTPITFYYLPGKAGWSTYQRYNTLVTLWKPKIFPESNFGISSNLFGFTINWTSGMVTVVEACTNLVASNWTPVQTNTLNSDSLYFSDSAWTNYPNRYYRITSP